MLVGSVVAVYNRSVPPRTHERKKKQIHFQTCLQRPFIQQTVFNTSIFAMRLWLLLRRTYICLYNWNSLSFLIQQKQHFSQCAACGLYVNCCSSHNLDAHLQIRFQAPSTNTSNKYWTRWRLLLDFLPLLLHIRHLHNSHGSHGDSNFRFRVFLCRAKTYSLRGLFPTGKLLEIKVFSSLPSEFCITFNVNLFQASDFLCHSLYFGVKYIWRRRKISRLMWRQYFNHGNQYVVTTTRYELYIPWYIKTSNQIHCNNRIFFS